ncbi:hypothetical protein X975_05481, partial [Stegodyphus mimosarum]
MDESQMIYALQNSLSLHSYQIDVNQIIHFYAVLQL